MMDEEKRETLWVPQREGAYAEHGELIRRFSQNKVPGISLRSRSRQEKLVWGFQVERGFQMKDGEDDLEDALALLVSKGDLVRIKTFCGMAEPCGIAECLHAAADAFHDDRLYRIEGDICSAVWHDEEKHCARFQLAADQTGKVRLGVYIEERDLTASDRETLRALSLDEHGMDRRVTVEGLLSLHNGAIQLRGYALEIVKGPSDYQTWCREEEAAFRQWLKAEGREDRRVSDVEKGKRLAERLGAGERPYRVGLIAPENSQGEVDFTSRLPHGKGQNFAIAETKHVNFMKAGEIAAAVAAFCEEKSCDCIAIVRGGGDRYGMNAFQTAELARAIAASPLPVVLGVGHAKDHFLCEQAADLPCRTPTDAAAALDEAAKAVWKKQDGAAGETWQAKIARLTKERDESREEAARLRQELAALQKELETLRKKGEAAQQGGEIREAAGSASAVSRLMGFLRRK